MLKILTMLTSLGAGAIVALAQTTPPSGSGMPNVNYIQYGSLGILAVLVIYVVTKLVPLAIESRRKESEAFLQTIVTEREKLVASMSALTKAHEQEIRLARQDTDKLIRDISTDHRQEYKAWTEVLLEVKVILGHVKDKLNNGQ